MTSREKLPLWKKIAGALWPVAFAAVCWFAAGTVPPELLQALKISLAGTLGVQ